jgi:hypothetical protein
VGDLKSGWVAEVGPTASPLEREQRRGTELCWISVMLKILCLLGVLEHVRTIWGCAITGSIDALVTSLSVSRRLTKGVIVVIFNDQFTTDIEYRPSLFLYG